MERPFDPVTLRIFVAVCEEGSIAAAAAREHVVASAVSKRIAAIEHDVGSPLLTRGRRGVAPTAAGETLLRQAREVLGIMARMHAELAEFATGVHGSVRVLASVSLLAGRLPDDIAGFLGRYRDVRVTVHEGTSARVAQDVRDGAADVGLVWDAAELSGLQTAPYSMDRLCVMVHAAHPLAHRKTIRFADLLDEPLIRVLPGGTLDLMLRRRAAALGRNLVHRIEVSAVEAACRIVNARLGVAVIPDEATRAQAKTLGLVLVPLADRWATRQFVVCARPDAQLSATARAMFRHLAAGPQSPAR
jgi:DNA-binding transcriptional LysR family regulator